MLEPNFIRQNQKLVKQGVADKGLDSEVVDEWLAIDKKRKAIKERLEQVRQERNKLKREFKKLGKKPPADKIQKAKKLREEITQLERDLAPLEKKWQELLLAIPNPPAPEVPRGDKPKVVRRWGKPKKFDFKPRPHWEIMENLGWVDLKRGAKVAGFRGYFLKGEGAVLQLKLMLWAFGELVKKGFTPFVPPVLLKKPAFYYTGHFPWGKKETYKTKTGEKKGDWRFLAGTAEVPMVAYHAGEILKEEQLPLRYVAFSPCYRREIGNYGKDTRGIYRVHEFFKVEQVVICRNDLEESKYWWEELVKNAEWFLQKLNLPYRVILNPSLDLGEAQYIKYDIEVWMPGRGGWGEVCSDSILLDFQSRRAKIRYRTTSGEIKYVHMLNCTALVVPRVLIALVENYQTADGKVKLPKFLTQLLSG